ncbi:MAG: hypothetical protein JWN46_94 [Acidimicrobiales bacterium]|nr:hypothetical protein [Acidimicrobiales bacterium]
MPGVCDHAVTAGPREPWPNVELLPEVGNLVMNDDEVRVLVDFPLQALCSQLAGTYPKPTLGDLKSGLNGVVDENLGLFPLDGSGVIGHR